MTASFKAPAAVLDELGVTEPADIDVEAIAQHCGATVVYRPLDGCAARIIGVGDRAIITVNASAKRPRQRFSAAHELGHWMRDRGKVAFACTEQMLVREWDGDNPERRANRYAADLLLPRRLFQAAARGEAPLFEGARRLAASFETSVTATAIRLVEVGDAPSMIVCNTKEGRRWFFRSSLVRLWPVSRPGAGTQAAKLLSGTASQAAGPVTVDADEWIDDPKSSQYVVVEDSVVAGGAVLSLLWWKDESQILDADDDDDDGVKPLTGHLTFGGRRR